MGVPREAGAGAIRLSLGRTTTREELETLLGLLTAAVPPGSGS
jgi:cysteine sulfinate desulfinase/cysteine desulfurase-like protein